MEALNATPAERRRAYELIDAPRAVLRLREMATGDTPFSSAPAMPVAGDLLKAMRLRRGWTLEQTAVHLQISPATLSRWERAETWPSTEDLHRLCYALNARSEELAALSYGRQLLRYDQQPFPHSLLALHDLVQAVGQGKLPVEHELSDLFHLALEGHLWRLMQRQEEPARAMLITVYVHHARTLLNDARLMEAQTPALRALHLMSQSHPLECHWLDAIHIIAKGAAEGGRKFRPMQGVEVLRDWLPVAIRLSITYEAWFLRDIAEYLSQTRSRTRAVETSEYAMQRGMGIGEDKNVLLSHVLVLLNVGRAEDALMMLESNPLLAWDEGEVLIQKVQEALIWARALYGAGRETEAMRWQERTRQLVAQHNLWQIGRRVEVLNEQLRMP